MKTEFDKCDHCGTWHEIKTITWGDVPIKTCPHIPSGGSLFFYTGISDPDDERTISATHRAPA